MRKTTKAYLATWLFSSVLVGGIMDFITGGNPERPIAWFTGGIVASAIMSGAILGMHWVVSNILEKN